MTKIKRIQELLEREGLDAVILRDPKNRVYATGFASSAGFALITRREAFFVTDSRYIESARANIKGMTVGQSSTSMSESVWLEQIIRDTAISTLGFEEDTTSWKDYQKLEDETIVQLIPTQNIMTELRSSKSLDELEHIKAAQVITDRAFDTILGIIKPGMTERDVAAELTYLMMKYGGEGNSFPPIVVTGKKSSMPHGTPGDEIISPGDFLTMDFGCVINSYCSDMTRTIAIGSATDEMKTVYNTVLEAQLAGIAAAKAGVMGSAIDKAARDVIVNAGYGDYFGHSFGHGLGLDVHETPGATPTEKKILPEGAVISAEPGIYIPGKFGVRIEDLLYLTQTGCENITKSPKDLIIL